MICVSQAGASCPLTCALGIFMGAFHPALCPGSASARNRDAWCSVGAHGFYHGKWPLAFQIAHFFPLRGRVIWSPLVNTPPIGPENRVSPVGRSAGSSSPIEKKRHFRRDLPTFSTPVLSSRDRDVAGRVRSRCQPKVCWLAGRDLACAASSTATARLRLLVVSANSTCCLHCKCGATRCANPHAAILPVADVGAALVGT